jgi:hypothetical protein
MDARIKSDAYLCSGPVTWERAHPQPLQSASGPFGLQVLTSPSKRKGWLRFATCAQVTRFTKSPLARP